MRALGLGVREAERRIKELAPDEEVFECFRGVIKSLWRGFPRRKNLEKERMELLQREELLDQTKKTRKLFDRLLMRAIEGDETSIREVVDRAILVVNVLNAVCKLHPEIGCKIVRWKRWRPALIQPNPTKSNLSKFDRF